MPLPHLSISKGQSEFDLLQVQLGRGQWSTADVGLKEKYQSKISDMKLECVSVKATLRDIPLKL